MTYLVAWVGIIYDRGILWDEEVMKYCKIYIEIELKNLSKDRIVKNEIKVN